MSHLRAKLHTNIARWYECKHQDNLPPVFHVLSMHWEQAFRSYSGSSKLKLKLKLRALDRVLMYEKVGLVQCAYH